MSRPEKEQPRQNKPLQSARRCYKAGLLGMILAAICCFTPLLVIALGFLGFAAVIPYLDRVLLPLLGICLILTAYGWWRMKHVAKNRAGVEDFDGPTMKPAGQLMDIAPLQRDPGSAMTRKPQLICRRSSEVRAE